MPSQISIIKKKEWLEYKILINKALRRRIWGRFFVP